MDIFSMMPYEEVDIKNPDMFAALGIYSIRQQERSLSLTDEDDTEWTLKDIMTDSEHNGVACQDRDIYLSKQSAHGKLTMRLWLTGMEPGHQRVNVFACDHDLSDDFNTKDEFMKGLNLLAGGENK